MLARHSGVVAAVACLLVVSSARADKPHGEEPADPSKTVPHDPTEPHHDPVEDPAEHEHEHGHGHEHEHVPEVIDVTVTAGDAPGAASAQTVVGGELKLRPRLRPGDVLSAAPGLVVVQHAGGGKANQYFLRGFDIDHGTDLLVMVDGMPVNLVSHGHGQGYADVHFVIPELIASLEVYKGPYYTELGDFATAGAVDMRLANHMHESQASFTLGQYGIMRGLGIVSREIGEDWRFVLAGEVYGQKGPFENPEKLRRFNGYLSVTHDLTPTSSLGLTWMSYSGRWNASGQIPLREVEAGRLDRFGTIDPDEGGATQRHGGSLRLKSTFETADIDVRVYALRYDWHLFSNFTFFLEDPVNGDMIEQTDARTQAGLDARTTFHHHLGSVRLETRVGAQARLDDIDNALYHDVARERLETRVQAQIMQTNIGLFAEECALFAWWIELCGGVRADRLDVIVEDELDDPAVLGDSGDNSAGDMLFSPKSRLVLSPIEQLQLFLDFGRGFHSNDARGATRRVDPATLLVPATGYEVGVRVRPWEQLSFTAAAFRLDLDSEQVYVGDAGTTEPSAPSSRLGVELGARFHWDRWLYADVDVTLNKAELESNAGNADAVALAPTRTITGGIGFRAPWGIWDATTFGAIRVRHVGDRPANEDESITAEGFTILDAELGQRVGPFEATVDVQNMFDFEWREVQFATESRLRDEAAPVEEIHFAPGWPITVRGTLTAYF